MSYKNHLRDDDGAESAAAYVPDTWEEGIPYLLDLERAQQSQIIRQEERFKANDAAIRVRAIDRLKELFPPPKPKKGGRPKIKTRPVTNHQDRQIALAHVMTPDGWRTDPKQGKLLDALATQNLADFTRETDDKGILVSPAVKDLDFAMGQELEKLVARLIRIEAKGRAALDKRQETIAKMRGTLVSVPTAPRLAM